MCSFVNRENHHELPVPAHGNPPTNEGTYRILRPGPQPSRLTFEFLCRTISPKRSCPSLHTFFTQTQATCTRLQWAGSGGGATGRVALLSSWRLVCSAPGIPYQVSRPCLVLVVELVVHPYLQAQELAPPGFFSLGNFIARTIYCKKPLAHWFSSPLHLHLMKPFLPLLFHLPSRYQPKLPPLHLPPLTHQSKRA